MQSDESTDIPFDLFTEKLLPIYQLRAAKTCDSMMKVIRLLKNMGVKSTSDLDTTLIAHYIAGRKLLVCVNTIIGELGYIRAACEYAVEEGWLRRNPLASRRLKLRAEPIKAKTHHSMKEISKVLLFLGGAHARGGMIEHRLYALASTVAFTGLRKMEAILLKREDIRFDKGMILVIPRQALKTPGSAAPVPIPPELVPILEKWLASNPSEWVFPNSKGDKPWTSGTQNDKALDQMKRAGRLVGVDGFTFKSLRHSWATHGESAWGLTEEQIQRVLRHTNPFTQAGYRHADEPNLRAIGTRVSYLTSLPLAASA